MSSRPFHVAMLLFVTLWFGVIAPGHERGAVRLPGSDGCHATTSASATAGRACCALLEEAEQDEPQRSEDPASCCAICYLNGTLDVPPPLVIHVTFLGLLAELAPLEPEQLLSFASPRWRPIRGPPAITPA